MKRTMFCWPVALAILLSSYGGNAWARTVEFDFDEANFPDPAFIDNPYLPLSLIGGPLAFIGITEDECEISLQTLGFAGPVADGYAVPAEVAGVPVLVVRDQEWVTEAEDGECYFETAELQEDTIDFYAQQITGSGAGSAWYLGEYTFAKPDVDEGEGPECSTEGGWEAEVGGAAGGILMLASPRAGDRYQQEFDEDNAEDMALVLRTNSKVSIEFDDFTGCLVTKEWTPLEPGSVEKKYYCEEDGGFPGGLALVEELKGKTLRVEYVDPSILGELPGDGDEFPAFDALDCDDPAE